MARSILYLALWRFDIRRLSIVMRPGLPGIGKAISTAVHASSVIGHAPVCGRGVKARLMADQSWEVKSRTRRSSTRPRPLARATIMPRRVRTS